MSQGPSNRGCGASCLYGIVLSTGAMLLARRVASEIGGTAGELSKSPFVWVVLGTGLAFIIAILLEDHEPDTVTPTSTQDPKSRRERARLAALHRKVKGELLGFERMVYLGHQSSHECVLSPKLWQDYYREWVALEGFCSGEELHQEISGDLASHAAEQFRHLIAADGLALKPTASD